jgi:hypothetical protein
MRRLAAVFIFGLAAVLVAQPPADKFDQASVPLEVRATDPKLTPIVLIAGVGNQGPGEHEYFAGCALLAKLLKQTPGVWPILVRDGWPKDEKVFDDAKCVVLFLTGGGTQPAAKPENVAMLAKLAERGVGLVHLHSAIDYPRATGEILWPYLGGYWDKAISCRSHWVADFAGFPEHPITRGVGRFQIDDGWLFVNRFLPDDAGLVPLAKVTPPEKNRTTAEAKKYPGRGETVGWAYTKPNGNRAFTFTGGHLHSSWGIESYRRFIANGVLWSAGLDIPANGAPVVLAEDELQRHMDRKPAKGK